MSGPALKSAPIALTIAGSDSSGGAGIQADLKTFTALGVYGASILTALTAQNTMGVRAIHSVPPEFILAQADAVASDLSIGAVKTGMLGDVATVSCVADLIQRFALKPLVVDPVMVATSGDVLLAPEAIATVRSKLIPLADLITPNLHEAAHLIGAPLAASIAEMEAQGRRLLDLGCKAVLVKGGHGMGVDAIDVLVTAAGVRPFSAPRVDTRNTHGTGCTLSAAITAELALGRTDLAQAVAAAKEFLTQALKSGRQLRIGHGSGPVDHLFALRGRLAENG